MMNNIYDNNHQLIDIDDLALLSTRGSEVTVYYDLNYTYKIFKTHYKLKHKTLEEISYLSSFTTSRILMPISPLYSNHQLVGYKMEYISGSQDILDNTFDNLLKELLVIKADIELLSNHGIRLMDINKSNIIYNGKLFFIDFGNYYINNIEDLSVYFPNKILTKADIIDIIRKWNYDKVNKLIHELLFFNNPNIDFYRLRKIIEFFNDAKEKEETLYDYDIYDRYFNKQLLIRDSICEFIKMNIKEDKEEKKKLLSLLKN